MLADGGLRLKSKSGSIDYLIDYLRSCAPDRRFIIVDRLGWHKNKDGKLFFALKDKVIARIAAKHNATPAQVILAWAMGEGYSVIPSSTKRENLESNLKAQNLQLDAEDKKAIAALDCNDRLVSPEGLAPEWD